eukprot:TRINITY_DN27505_c0_g1_i1.p2 TRINITY_DN27505_c0_g1~~TRINITY_DN27505_c0_g1_i1.p2  ORF type:complete len:600 (+),score=206.84 TRINITY_DN27505_c0_g1_i1:121-1920(+)
MSTVNKWAPGPEPKLKTNLNRRGRSRSSSSSGSSRSSSSSSSSSASSGSAAGHKKAAEGVMKNMVAKPPQEQTEPEQPKAVPGQEAFPFGEFDPNATLIGEQGALVPKEPDVSQFPGTVATTPALPAPPGEGGDDDMDAHQLSLAECGEEEHPGGQLEIKGLPHNWFFPEVMMLLRVNGCGRWAKILELGPDDDDDDPMAAAERHRKKGPITQTAVVAYARAEDAKSAAQILDGQKPGDGKGKPLECGWTTCKRDDEDMLGLKNEEVEPDDMGVLNVIDDRPKKRKAPEPEIMEAPAEPVVKDSDWAERGARGGWKCNLCGVFTNAEQGMMVHLRGRRHQTRLRRYNLDEAKRLREEEWQQQRLQAEEEFAALRRAELEAMAQNEAAGLVSEMAGGPAKNRLKMRIVDGPGGPVNIPAGGLGPSSMPTIPGMPNPYSVFQALERRVDTVDGRMYTYQDFIIQYGPLDGGRRWELAAHTSSHSPQNAAFMMMQQQAAVSQAGVSGGMPGMQGMMPGMPMMPGMGMPGQAWGGPPAGAPGQSGLGVVPVPGSTPQGVSAPQDPKTATPPNLSGPGITGVPAVVQPEATDSWKPGTTTGGAE